MVVEYQDSTVSYFELETVNKEKIDERNSEMLCNHFIHFKSV